jgi:Na+-driven multidrug efflux pump
MLTTTVSMWLIRLPLAWFFVVHQGWGLPGAYAGFVLGSTLEAVAVYLRYRAGAWQRTSV